MQTKINRDITIADVIVPREADTKADYCLLTAIIKIYKLRRAKSRIKITSVDNGRRAKKKKKKREVYQAYLQRELLEDPAKPTYEDILNSIKKAAKETLKPSTAKRNSD